MFIPLFTTGFSWEIDSNTNRLNSLGLVLQMEVLLSLGSFRKRLPIPAAADGTTFAILAALRRKTAFFGSCEESYSVFLRSYC